MIEGWKCCINAYGPSFDNTQFTKMRILALSTQALCCQELSIQAALSIQGLRLYIRELIVLTIPSLNESYHQTKHSLEYDSKTVS